MAHVHLDRDEDNVVVSLIRHGLVPTVGAFLEEDWAGLENIPANGPAVLAYNHLSTSDPFVAGRFALVGAGRLPHFLGKAEVFAVPVIGRLLLKAGQVPVHRGSARAKDSFAAAVEALESGKVVCLLPEGTLTHDPDLWPMNGKTGAARLALQTGAPLIPIAVWGPQDILPPRALKTPDFVRAFTRKHRVRVRAGAPVNLDDLRAKPMDAAVLAEATNRLMDAITMLLAQIRNEPAPASRMANPRVVSRNVKTMNRRERGSAL